MSRASTSQQRGLTLTEELEKLEQSITLTMQEIDHNFSKAHRIVTTSILPIVEQYAEQSKNVWEGSRFWKQFFESSANVSLSGYEEQPADNTLPTDTTHTTLVSEEAEPSSYETLSSEHFDLQPESHLSADSDHDIDLSALSLSPSHSTPRAPASNRPKPKPTFADYPSPYETLKQEIATTSSPILDTPPLPSTPGKSPYLRNQSRAIATTPSASFPFLPPTSKLTNNPPPSTTRRDPLLHRVLDRNYRIQATPHTATRRNNTTTRPGTAKLLSYPSSSPLSSPEIQAPQLHAEIFSSPVRKARTPSRPRAAPKPGISVLTPAKAKAKQSRASLASASKNPDLASVWPSSTASSQKPTSQAAQYDEWADSDSDDDGGLPFGRSPPKTMTFHVPQRRLLQTPAKEASKRIVSDLLMSAGHGRVGNGDGEECTDEVEIDEFDIDIDAEAYEMGEATSPSVVRAGRVEDESF